VLVHLDAHREAALEEKDGQRHHERHGRGHRKMPRRDTVDHEAVQPGDHKMPRRDSIDHEATQAGDHVIRTHGFQRPANQTCREKGPPVDMARCRPLRHVSEQLKIRKPLPALPTRVHVKLQRDTLRERDVPLEEHGERLASILTIHGEGSPPESWRE
jgi:hypothetical protein